MNSPTISTMLWCLCSAMATAQTASPTGFLLFTSEGHLHTMDIASGETSLVLRNARDLVRHPGDRARFLIADTETLYEVAADGTKRKVMHRKKIVHPGCHHIESSITGYQWAAGGRSIRVTIRVVPEGTDPHEYDESQNRELLVRAGEPPKETKRRHVLHSDYHNLGTIDVAPDGARFIASRKVADLDGDDGIAIELYERSTDGEERVIGRYELPVLSSISGRWSPDGQGYLFYHRWKNPGARRASFRLYVWANGKVRKIHESPRLGLGGTGRYVMEWSPDGKKVAIIEDGGSTLVVLDAEKGGVVRAWRHGHKCRPELSRPVWLADSRRLTALTHECPMETGHQHRFAACRPVLELFDLNTESPKVLADHEVAYLQPVATDDGRRILFFEVVSQSLDGDDAWAEPKERRIGIRCLDLESGESHRIAAGRTVKDLRRPWFVLDR